MLHHDVLFHAPAQQLHFLGREPSFMSTPLSADQRTPFIVHVDDKDTFILSRIRFIKLSSTTDK